MTESTRKKITPFAITIVAAMSALSTVIYLLFPEIPIVPGVSYMKIDFSDFPALLTGMCFGPVSGVAVGIIKNLFHLMKTTTFGIGELMNVGIIAAMVFSMHGFGKLFEKLFKSTAIKPKVYFISSVITVFITILAGWLLNAALTPVFYIIMGIPVTTTSVLAGVVGSTLLNAVKAALNLIPFYPVYAIMKKVTDKLN